MDSSAGQHLSFRTMCGREIEVGHLVPGGGGHPAERVSLRIGGGRVRLPLARLTGGQ